jgi:uncharacterized protein YybS (DUF2232 family)
MLSYPNQVRRDTLGTDVIQALVDHSQGIVDPSTICLTPLPATFLSLQAAVHESDQALAVLACHGFHLTQELASLLSVSLRIPLLHLAQVLSFLIYGHLIVNGHVSSGNIIIWRNHTTSLTFYSGECDL